MTSLRIAALERYRRWNSAIYATLFGEPRPQAPVYLFLEPDLLAAAAALVEAGAGDAQESLIAAVRGSLGWDRVDTPFLWHSAEAGSWVDEGMRDAPPFLALLVVLVLGAEAMVGDAHHAPHNYYSRLIELLGADETLAGRIKRSFKDTVELWLLLNDWLVQWDGELGLPSAQVTDRRVNIGYPISQALVSAQDRRRMAIAFEDYGLRPGRRMAPLEMDQYLDHWLGHSSAPSRLKRLWANSEPRRRITLIACAELEAWHGPAAQVAAEQAVGRVPLLWRADLIPGALPSIDLFLACQADASRVEGSYHIIAPTDLAGREGLECAADALSITQMRGSELCALEPWDKVSVGALLAGAFTLERAERPAVTLARSSNPILVLTYDERDALWHEVTRAQLLERCVVLAHADILDKVEPHLARYARPGYRKLDGSMLDGLPPGWAAFLDVVLADAPEDELRTVLAALAPMRADVIRLEGGLRLGRQTWHADAPPEIAATLISERMLQLKVEGRRLLEAGPESMLLAKSIGRAGASLVGAGLVSGDYLASLTSPASSGAQLIDEAPFRLRTASYPRPARPGGGIAGYLLGQASGLVSASSIDDEDLAIAQGALLEGSLGDGFASMAPTLPAKLAPAAAPPPKEPGPPPDLRSYAMPCAVRNHHWIVDRAEPGDSWYTLKHMQCRECQREEWRRSGMKRKAAATGHQPSFRRALASARARLPAAATTEWSRPTPALILDALSYIGAGSWAGLREMAQALSPDDPYLASEAARALAALGHIDIILDPRTQRPASWQIAPATLVETYDGSWVLAGARSDRLTSALLEARNISIVVEGESEGLPVYRFRPETSDALLELVEELEAEGHMIAISERFSERLASQLQPLSTLLDSAEPFRMGTEKVERLDLASRQWIAAREDQPAGAYRIQHHGRLHGISLAGEPGLMRITDPLTAKHLAAAQAGVPFLAYDPVDQVLSVPLGAELPGLLDRVASLCSGAPAIVRRDTWSVHYPSVPVDVAGHIQRVLGL